MPSAFICWSSRRISDFSTAVPNHHQRTMGLESAGGLLKSFMRDCVEVCANKCSDAVKNEAMRMAAACGNLEDKRVMFVDYSCFAVAAGAGAGPWRVGAEQPLEGWE